jgi:hypothetical protein
MDKSHKTNHFSGKHPPGLPGKRRVFRALNATKRRRLLGAWLLAPNPTGHLEGDLLQLEGWDGI